MKHGPTNTRWLKEYRINLVLSKKQKEILVGNLLGDGHLQPSRSGLLARLQVRQSIRSTEYLNWQYQIWKLWTLKGLTFDKSNNSVVLRSIFHSEFVIWRKIFYEGRKKVVPKEIDNLLTSPLSLAVWFMDDGNGSKTNIWLRLSTYAFGFSGNQALQNCLEKNFGLTAKIYEDSKGSYLWFSKTNALRLYRLIKPFIVPCMEYKFKTLQHC